MPAVLQNQFVGNALDAMPGCGRFPLTIEEVNFNIESLLKGDDSIIGACAFIFMQYL